jgi:hypothetical protein
VCTHCTHCTHCIHKRETRCYTPLPASVCTHKREHENDMWYVCVSPKKKWVQRYNDITR